MTARTLARAVAVLFVVTAALFVIGTQSESDEHNEATETQPTDAKAGEGEDGEQGEEGEGHEESTEAADDDEAGEEILGVNPESTGAIVLGVALSVPIAAALWFRPLRPVAVAAAAFGAAFAVLDVLEVTRKLDEDRTGLAVLAAVVALGHAAAALAAGRLAALATPALEEP